jgi:hypothetical protein
MISRHITLMSGLILASSVLYGVWVYQRTDGYFVGLSWARIRWAHMSDEQRDRATCLGAHGSQDAREGHPRSFCMHF